ncbi:MAG: UDPGP type 1 family protein, partial [Opitutaceae bacterium]
MSQHPLIEKFARAGQGQVFAHWTSLGETERANLLAEAAEIDLAEVERLTRTLLRPGAAAGVDLEGLAPAPYERHPANGGDRAAWHTAKAAGEAALRAGRVAAFTVAGWPGTRLGYQGRKGKYAVRTLGRMWVFQNCAA